MADGVRERVGAVLERMRAAERRAGRAEGTVRLVAATKGVELPPLLEAVGAGVRILGENRVQEAERKRSSLPGEIEYHMIGHLQKNKVKKALDLFDCIQSLSSERLARELSAEAHRRGRAVRVLLEINIANEESKSGFLPDAARAAYGEISGHPGLALSGLMCIPPFVPPEEARPYFRQLRALGEELFGSIGHELSMGMSGDFEQAIEEGATMVRIGTAIFGERTG